jgi:enediyne biosynthesis protein E4
MRAAILVLLFAAATESPVVNFVDIAAQSGLTAPNTFGGKETKTSILESTGTGVAIFDFDGDGANDIFLANGPPSRSQLYRNDGTGHFTEVGQQAGLTYTGWAQAACVGDIDNDGHPDLFVTYYGHNVLYRNLATANSKTLPRERDCR